MLGTSLDKAKTEPWPRLRRKLGLQSVGFWSLKVRAQHGNNPLANKEVAASHLSIMSPQPILQNVLYLRTGEENTGPYHISQVKSMWNAGLITADALCWRETWPEWMLVSKFLGLEDQIEPIVTGPQITLETATSAPEARTAPPNLDVTTDAAPAEKREKEQESGLLEQMTATPLGRTFSGFLLNLFYLLPVMVIVRFGWLLLWSRYSTRIGNSARISLIDAVAISGLGFLVFGLCAVIIGGTRAARRRRWPDWNMAFVGGVIWFFFHMVFRF